MNFQYHSINPQNDDIHLNANATIIKCKSNNLQKGMTGQYYLDQVFFNWGRRQLCHIATMTVKGQIIGNYTLPQAYGFWKLKYP